MIKYFDEIIELFKSVLRIWTSINLVKLGYSGVTVSALVYFSGPWENILMLWQYLTFYRFRLQISLT